MHRALLTCGAAAALLLTLAGCSSAPSTATVRGRVSLSAGAFDAPGATGTDAATCVSHAQSDDDLTACETRALAATKDVACTAVSAAIRPGTEVDVLDDGDKVLAIGRLGRGRTTDSGHTCTYPFTAASVPSTGRVYGLRIGPVGAPTHYTKQELFGHPVVLSVD